MESFWYDSHNPKTQKGTHVLEHTICMQVKSKWENPFRSVPAPWWGWVCKKTRENVPAIKVRTLPCTSNQTMTLTLYW